MLDDIEKTKCKVCRKSFELSNMGRGALTSHQTKSEKHKCLMSAFLVKLKPKSAADNKQDSVSYKSNDVSGETNDKSKQQATLEVVVDKSQKLKLRLFGL